MGGLKAVSVSTTDTCLFHTQCDELGSKGQGRSGLPKRRQAKHSRVNLCFKTTQHPTGESIRKGPWNGAPARHPQLSILNALLFENLEWTRQGYSSLSNSHFGDVTCCRNQEPSDFVSCAHWSFMHHANGAPHSLHPSCLWEADWASDCMNHLASPGPHPWMVNQFGK